MPERSKRATKSKTKRPAKGRRTAAKTVRDEDGNGATESRGPRAFWSGTLSFGLVSIPVEFLPANTAGSRVAFRMLSEGGTPLRREYVSAEGEPLPWENIVRGYELEPGKYVVLTDEELEAALPEKTRDIALRSFVPRESIPPIYFRRGYYLVPAGDSTRAYDLLADTMERSGMAGIATFVMRAKEYAVAIFAENGVLRGETLRFADEIRLPQDIGLPSASGVEPKDVDRFAKFIKAHAKDAVPQAETADALGESIRKVAESKRKRAKDVVEISEEAETHEVATADLMEELKRRLAAAR
jgi:DNA end-binding protein Ku